MVEEKKLSEKIYLFTGENRFSLQQEIEKWVRMFKEKNGPESVFSFNSENRDYTNIKQTIFGWWFFITNKLVILYGIPLDTEKSNAIKADEIEKIADDLMNYDIPMWTLVVCVSYKPDKRSRFYKFMDKVNSEYKWKIKTYALLDERELPLFIQNEAADLNLSSESINTLIQKVWNDQYRLVSEIEKLRYWKKINNKNITSEIVEKVCFWMVEDDIFKLLDLILTDSQQAVKFVCKLQEKWMDWNAVNGSFSRWLRNYVLLLDYIEHWITDSKVIASELKQNPRVISNTLKKWNQLKQKKKLIHNLFNRIVEIDNEIKNWNAQPESYFLTIKTILLQE